jgi:hypothetical protein
MSTEKEERMEKMDPGEQKKICKPSSGQSLVFSIYERQPTTRSSRRDPGGYCLSFFWGDQS